MHVRMHIHMHKHTINAHTNMYPHTNNTQIRAHTNTHMHTQFYVRKPWLFCQYYRHMYICVSSNIFYSSLVVATLSFHTGLVTYIATFNQRVLSCVKVTDTGCPG